MTCRDVPDGFAQLCLRAEPDDELADDALVALMTAGVLSERPPEHTTEAPDEPV